MCPLTSPAQKNTVLLDTWTIYLCLFLYCLNILIKKHVWKVCVAPSQRETFKMWDPYILVRDRHWSQVYYGKTNLHCNPFLNILERGGVLLKNGQGLRKDCLGALKNLSILWCPPGRQLQSPQVGVGTITNKASFWDVKKHSVTEVVRKQVLHSILI